MNILLVKLSSLGDVVHTLPVVHDLRATLSDVRIAWVVERGFAPLVQRCEGVDRVIPCELRRWRKAPFAASTRAEWRAFRDDLRAEPFDAVIDLQGLTKSALVSRMAPLVPGGKRFAMANATAGSSYERPTRWVADIAIPLEQQLHAMERAREVCARALAYALSGPAHYGLSRAEGPRDDTVVLIHGTSRDDKCWPETHWLDLGRRLLAQGHALALPHGNAEEEARSRRLATALGPRAEVWPRLSLDALTQRMARCAGAIGVDSGLSHIAVALDLPHVQVYNFDTAWRTGPQGNPRQQAVYAQPTPSVDAVWRAWQGVTMAG